MNEVEKTLRCEIEALRTRLSEAEDVLHAIQTDQVDAVVVYTSRGDQIFTLKSTEHPYRVFVEKIQEGTISLASDGTILYSNQHFATLAGQPLQKVMGAPIGAFFEEGEASQLGRLLAGCNNENARGEFLMKGSAGPIPVYLTASRYTLEDEQGICVIVTDRSEHQRNEEMAEKLRHSERLASIGTLASGIAHEINNPLNSILLSAEYAHGIAPTDHPELTGTLKTIIEETQRCGRIIKNVLAFAKSEETRAAPADLNAVLRHAVQLARTYTRCELELSFELDPALPPVMLNAMEFEQVVINLLRNSCEAGGNRAQVCIATRRLGNEAEVRISDRGPGIPPEIRSRIFDPFFSTKREHGGTGLGLSIVHGIVTKHGGSIDVESEPGAGTTFKICLPLAPDSASGESGKARESRLSPPRGQDSHLPREPSAVST